MSAGEQYQLYSNAVPGQTGHDVILQTLDTWRNYTDSDGNTKKLFFGTDNFTGTEPEWNQTGLIYGSNHPKTGYRINSAQALTESQGRVVGSFVQPKTVTVGSPRFEGKFVFTDPEVQSLHDAGELQFSSGFVSDIDDDGKLRGKVTPDHILIFRKSKDGIQPQDGGTMFLNAQVTKMDDESKGYLKSIIEMLGKLVPSSVPITNASPEVKPTMTDELTNKIAVLNATIETQTAAMTAHEATIADLTAKVQGFEAEKAQALEAKQEADWQNIKENVLAPGLTATPELEAEQKATWLNDKDGFYCNAIAAAATRPAPKGRDGNLIANAAGNPDAEMDAIFATRPGVPGTFH